MCSIGRADRIYCWIRCVARENKGVKDTDKAYNLRNRRPGTAYLLRWGRLLEGGNRGFHSGWTQLARLSRGIRKAVDT